jgi:hypothetical protein
MDEPAASGDAAAPTPEPPAAAEASLAEPLLRHYLFAVSTLGGYLVFRGYRVARRLDEGARAGRVQALAWACAALFAPAACAYLYEAGRLTRARIAVVGAAPGRWSLALPPLLYLAIGVGLLASRLSALWAPLVLLLPIPFVLLQADLNRLEAARLEPSAGPTAARTRAPSRWWIAALLPIAAFCLWRLDGRAARSLRTARVLAANSEVANASGSFSLRVPSRGWEQVAAGGIGDGGEALGLRKDRNEVWVVVYTQTATGTSLDEVVGFRRGLIQEERAYLLGIEETRFFLTGADLVPASYAKYRLKYPTALAVYMVLTTTVGDEIVEVVGFGYPDNQQDVEKLVRSLKVGARPR